MKTPTKNTVYLLSEKELNSLLQKIDQRIYKRTSDPDTCESIKAMTREFFKTFKTEQPEPVSTIKESKEELLDCIHNLIGVFDTPVARMKLNNDFTNEARNIGRTILENNGRSRYPA